ncbi:hypothetical protein BUALT_Bualt16G0119200 [Buddleja alternifolia]|uniref:Uncharacterized protein n=1 Tax=Buddleja alternifolia TaxID=168488 RepID=A0AAV6W8X8_9LAMI|nr:hypothetical protein BUALT_Bualt16G0119200 [Buddleja alternifolia]
MRRYEQIIVPNTLPRTDSCNSTGYIIPNNYITSTMASSPLHQDEFRHHNQPIVRRVSAASYRLNAALSTFLRSLLSVFIPLPTCRWLAIPSQVLSITPSLGRKVTGTLFGNRRGHVSFAVQANPRSAPILMIELAVTTSTLVREMSSGILRIALECKKALPPPRGGGRAAVVRLSGEPVWTMYCNGRNCGYAMSRACNESDWGVLSTVQSVSVGAGVIPVVDDGGKGGASEGALLYMRARFERVVRNRDSEAFYMLNPDRNGGGPELVSIKYFILSQSIIINNIYKTWHNLVQLLGIMTRSTESRFGSLEEIQEKLQSDVQHIGIELQHQASDIAEIKATLKYLMAAIAGMNTGRPGPNPAAVDATATSSA